MLAKAKTVPIFIFLLICIVAFVYLLKSGTRSRATLSSLAVRVEPEKTNVGVGETFNVYVYLTPGQGNKISGADLSFKFDPDGKDNLEYVPYTGGSSEAIFPQLPANAFTDKVYEAVLPQRQNNAKVLRLVLVAKKADADLPDTVKITLKMKAKTAGNSGLGLLIDKSQVVGPVANNVYQISTADSFKSVSVSAPVYNAKLDMTFKFQGLNRTGASTVQKATVTLTGYNFGYSQTQTVILKADSNSGAMRGEANFSGIDPDKEYFIYVKGDKHLRRKVCDSHPTENQPGSYRCASRGFKLVSGDNRFSFWGITLLSGDLAPQDGIINAYDLSLIVASLGKKDTDSLAKADINQDSIVDTEDYALAVASLGVKYDDE